MKQITPTDEGPPYLYECSNGHQFDVDPSDYTNTEIVNAHGLKVQIEKCPTCGEMGNLDRHKPEPVTDGKRFVVRRNCEYSVVVTANNATHAVDLASRIPHHDWSGSWSGMEAEKEK